MRDLHSMTVDSHHHGKPPERPSRGGSRWTCPTDSPYWATTSCRVSIAPDPSRATKSVGSPAFAAIRFPAARRNTSLLHSGEHVREFGVIALRAGASCNPWITQAGPTPNVPMAPAPLAILSQLSRAESLTDKVDYKTHA